jgi:hypothetical protein
LCLEEQSGFGSDRPSGKPGDRTPSARLGHAQLIDLLQVHPELRAGAEPVTQSQGSVGSDAAGSVDEPGDAIDGNVDLPSELRRRQPELAKLSAKWRPG